MENPFSLSGAAYVGAVFILAGAVKGISGLGLPTVAMALLGLVMKPGQAAALLILPSLATNLWQLAAGPGLGALLRRLWPMLAGIFAGTWAGSWLIGGHDAPWAGAALGLALMVYGGIGLAAVKLPAGRRHERLLSPLMGALTGGVTAVTGVFVIPAVPYLQGLALEKDELVQAMGLAFTCSTLALAASLAHAGLLHGAQAAGSLAALLPALAGMALGQRLRSRLGLAAFRRVLFGSLFLLGVDLALNWLSGIKA